MTTDYTDYLKSRDWERLRDRLVRQRAFECCELCGRQGERGKNGGVIGLNVHHLTYERLGHEHDDDLAVLCRECHEQLHELPAEDGGRSLKAIRLASSFTVYKALVSGELVDARDLDPAWARRYGVTQ